MVCGEQPRQHLERPPGLVVEVLSESTRRQDLVAKRELYSEQKVPHYLIIDPDESSVEHVALDGSRRYAIDQSIEFNILNDCRASIQCSRLFDVTSG